MDHLAPGNVAIPFDCGVRFAAFQSFFGEESCVNPAVDHPRATAAGDLADLIAAQGVAGVDTDAHDVSRLNAFGVDLFKRLVDEDGISGHLRRFGRKHKQPSWCDDRGSKGIVAGIYKTYTYRSPTSPGVSSADSGKVVAKIQYSSREENPRNLLPTSASSSSPVTRLPPDYWDSHTPRR